MVQILNKKMGLGTHTKVEIEPNKFSKELKAEIIKLANNAIKNYPETSDGEFKTLDCQIIIDGFVKVADSEY